MTVSTSVSGSHSESERDADPAASRLIPARITEIRRATPTISVFWLAYGARAYRFRPGQWIDLYVKLDGERRVGGYSITSTPSEPGRLRIAVRHSASHAVSHWLGSRAQVGDAVEISEGQGAFHYRSEHGGRLVLLAAGIGITPIMGIWRELYESHPEVSATLLYGAREPAELLFREELDETAAARANLLCHYAVSRAGASAELVAGRVGALLEREGVDPQATYYFCGPPALVDDLCRTLGTRGVDERRLVYERWW